MIGKPPIAQYHPISEGWGKMPYGAFPVAPGGKMPFGVWGYGVAAGAQQQQVGEQGGGGTGGYFSGEQQMSKREQEA